MPFHKRKWHYIKGWETCPFFQCLNLYLYSEDTNLLGCYSVPTSKHLASSEET